MTILTKPGISKGVPAQFSLNKANLLLHPTVQADSYFSEPLNWYRVTIVYKSLEGAQYELVEFDATQETPTGTFLVSEKARDVFEVLKIKIIDFDNGFLEIPRSELVTSEFDISMNVSPSIIAQASTDVPGLIQNRWSANQPHDLGEAQDFVLENPVLVSSVKVLLSKSGAQANTLNVTGNLKIVLKQSSYTGTGDTFESTTTFDLSNLQTTNTVLSDIENNVLEFTFDTPVLLQSGTNCLIFKLIDFSANPSTHYMSLFGYSPQVSPGDLFSFGNRVSHVDYWYQIIGIPA